MKKLFLWLTIIFILSSCFNKDTKVQVNDANMNNQIENNQQNEDISEIPNTNIEENLDEEIQKEEEILQSLEEINENEIDELINSIIE